MKIALLKIGSRILHNNKSVSGGEAESIIKILCYLKLSVHAYTKVLDKDQIPDNYFIHNIEDSFRDVTSNNYDILVVINGNVNYFGGQDDPSQTLIYYCINNFQGPVYYFLCDPALTLKQIWKSIEKKEWAAKYKKENIFISRTDIRYITQIFDLNKLKINLDKLNIEIKQDNIFHFDFQKFPLFTMEDEFINHSECEYDLLYGGTFRNAQREDDMIKYYWGLPDDIKVEMFGNIAYNHFKPDKIIGLRPPIFGKQVPYNKFNDKMKKSISTVIIGDKLYKKLDDLAQRIYESIRIGNFIFIDSSYDFNERVFKNKKLKEWSYVSSRNEMVDRLRHLKNNKNLFNELVLLQKQDIEFDKDKFCNNLLTLLSMNNKQNVTVQNDVNILNKIERPYFNLEYTLSKISDNEYSNINKYKKTFLLKENPNIKYLTYPGFVFSNIDDKNKYEKFYKNIMNVFTPPRGNLTQDCQYAIIGIQPGPRAIESKGESCWLIGDTSTKLLHKLLSDLNIYPYFTNVYLSYNKVFDKNVVLICEELTLIKSIVQKIKFVFLGSYDEYNLIVENLKLDSSQYIKIWHPAYLLRMNYDEYLYNKWKNSFIGKV